MQRRALLLAALSLQIGDIESADKEIERALAGATAEQASAVHYELLLTRPHRRSGGAAGEDTSNPPRAGSCSLRNCRARQGKADEAEQTLKRRSQQAPDDADMQLDLAKLAAARGDLQPAMELPERVAKGGAAHARALLLRGSIKMCAREVQRGARRSRQGSGQRRPQRGEGAREAEPRDVSSPKRTSRCRISKAQPSPWHCSTSGPGSRRRPATCTRASRC